LSEWFSPEMNSQSRSNTPLCAMATPFLEGTAEVAQPTTVYAFTGQGSQEQGMGIDLYNSSPAARAVWDSADAHLISAYGFSIVEIVRENTRPSTSAVSRVRQFVSAIWR
jgi:acyl transferase domain-containing protein